MHLGLFSPAHFLCHCENKCHHWTVNEHTHTHTLSPAAGFIHFSAACAVFQSLMRRLSAAEAAYTPDLLSRLTHRQADPPVGRAQRELSERKRDEKDLYFCFNLLPLQPCPPWTWVSLTWAAIQPLSLARASPLFIALFCSFLSSTPQEISLVGSRRRAAAKHQHRPLSKSQCAGPLEHERVHIWGTLRLFTWCL